MKPIGSMRDDKLTPMLKRSYFSGFTGEIIELRQKLRDIRLLHVLVERGLTTPALIDHPCVGVIG